MASSMAAEAPAAPWTPAEDTHIVRRFRELGAQWHTIAETLEGRSANQVRNRWMMLERGGPPGAPSAPWTPAEDSHLLQRFQELDEGVPTIWQTIADTLEGRSANEVRDRWMILGVADGCAAAPAPAARARRDPRGARGRWRRWTPAEDSHILQRFREVGNQWNTIAETLEGRSAIDVRNRWMMLSAGTGVRRVPPAAPQATYRQEQRADDLRFLRDLIERVNDAHPEVVDEGEYLRASNITCALWKENEGRAPMPHRGVESAATAALLHVAARARQ
jgi:hypothetical protein